MKLLGKTRVGGTYFELPANAKRVARYSLLAATRISKLTIYVDGLGSGNGDQVVRGVIYDAFDNLVAQGDEVVVTDGQAAGWVDLPFTRFAGGVPVQAGRYDFGVLGGTQTNSIRVYGDDPGSGALTAALPLTESGNEIIDSLRSAGQVGDGQGYVQVTNLVNNGGVEVDSTGWTSGFGPGSSGSFARVTSDSKFGSACAEFTTTTFQVGGSWAFAFATIQNIVQAGNVYTLSFWAKVTSGTQNYSVHIGDSTSANFVMPLRALQTLPVGTWTRVALTFTAFGNGNIPGVFITPTTAGTTGTIRLDGMQLEVGFQAHDYVDTISNAPQTQTQLDQVRNYTPNPSFEVDAGLVGNWANAAFSASLLQAKDGLQSLLVQNTAAGSNTYGSYDTVYLPAGGTFTASVWVYATVARNFQLIVRSKTSANVLIGADQTTGNIALLANQWTRISLTFTTPATTASVQVAVVSLASALNETYFMDAVQVELAPAATTYMAAPVYVPPVATTGVWEGTTNLISNPDFETDASGWTYAGSSSTLGSVTRDLSVSRFRVASLRATGIQAQNFTATGNEITDTLRAANVQGDGRGYQYVFNACPNGGAETNATGWSAVGSPPATISRSTVRSKFGSASILTVCDGTAATQGVGSPNTASGTATIGLTFTASAWVFSTDGTPLTFQIVERDSGGGFLLSSGFNFTPPVNQWVRVTLTRTVASASAVAVNLRFVTQAATPSTFNVDGAQIEVGNVAHDYVETNATAVGAIQGPLVTNYVLNGGFEYAATGWSNFGTGSIARTTAQQNFGLAAGAITVSAASDGAYTSVSLPPGTQCVASVYFKGTAGRSYKLSLTGISAGTLRASVTVVAGGNWQRVSISGASISTDSGLNVLVQAVAAGADTFYIDGAQLEVGYRAGTTPSTYVETSGVAASSAVGVADVSQGFWEASTNLALNGGVETNSTSTTVIGINPPTVVSAALGVSTGLTGTFQYRVSEYITNVNGTFESSSTLAGTVTAANQDVIVNLGTVGNTDATGRKVYRTSNGGTTWKLAATVVGTGAGTTYDDSTPDASLTTVSLPTANLPTVARVTNVARFGTASLQVRTLGSVAAEGGGFITGSGLARAPGVVMTGSGWIIGTPGVQLAVWSRVNNTDASITDSAHSTVTLTGDWQRVVAPPNTVAAGKTGDSYTMFFRTLNTGTLTTFNLDGVQIEEKNFATPYIHTNGATASRSGSFFTEAAATSYVTAGQGWVGAWMRMGVSSSTLATGQFQNMFSWSVDGTAANRIVGYYAQSQGKFILESDVASVNTSASVAATFSFGDLVYVEFAWTATLVAVSVNGANFVTTARTTTASGSNLNLFLGGAGSSTSGQIDGDMLWMGMGKGTRSNADTLATYTSLVAGVDPANTTFATANTLTALAPMATVAFVDWANSWPFIRTSPGSSVVAGTTYTFSVWALAPPGQAMSINLRRADFVTSWGQTNFTGTGSWQRVSITGVAPATEIIYPFVNSNATLVGGSFWVDGAQLEAKAFATPFVPASRTAARVQIPASLADETQVAVAFRVVYGVPSTATRPNVQGLFDWRDDSNNRISLSLQTNNTWGLNRVAGGAGASVFSAAQVFNIGDAATVVMACDSGHVRLSVNGSAFVSVANTTIPVLAATLIDLLTLAGTSSWFNGDVRWAAVMSGVPSDADAATLNAFGNTPPSFAAVPSSPSAVWDASTPTYVYTQSGRQNVDTYNDGASSPFGAAQPLDFDLSIFGTYVGDQRLPDEDDFYFARMPFDRAQQALDTGKVVPNDAMLANCSWHGTRADRERGSFVLVNSDGPLSDLVGERLKLTVGRGSSAPRTVVAYCHTRAALTSDLSVTRRLALALGVPGDEPTPVEVEVVA